MIEPRDVRWSRRAKTIPTMLAATVFGLLLAPHILLLAAIADVFSGRFRLPRARIYLFLLQYMVNDSVEVLLAPLLWVRAGFGRTLGSEPSITRHQKLQAWSIRLLERRADQLLGLRIEVPDGQEAELEPGPVIAVSRHASLFDASLAGMLYQRLGYKVQGIIMAELLADPGFDILYGRLGSVFIPRDDGAQALAAVRAMTASADARTAYVIYPEGRLFHPKVRDRSLARLSEKDPVRAERLAGLTHVLPPRPGGLLTLLAELPEADVVLVDHRGLDQLGRLADLVKVVPATEPVTVTVRRIARSEIPTDAEGRTRWLDELWLSIDDGLNHVQK